MPTLQSKFRPRRLLLVLASTVALAVPAFAGIEVEVRGIEGEMQRNVFAYLSFERYKESKELTPDFVERLQERCEREVRGALRPFGFYEPTITSQVKPEGADKYHVVIDVKPGEPVVVANVNVNVTGPGADSPRFQSILRNLEIRPGTRLNHAKYEELKGALLRTAATYGYLDSKMTKNEMRVDPQARVADIDIEFETGRQYKFGATSITQDVVDESLVRRFLRYHDDDEFSALQLLRTQFALDDSQYFSTVEVLPQERDTTNLTVPISITAEANRRNRYDFDIGYGTDTEERGTVSWENRRVNHQGHRFRAEVRAAANEQSLDARYIVPIGDPATENLTLPITGTHDRQADIDSRDISFKPSLTHLRGSWFSKNQSWQRVSYVELLDTQSEFVESGRRVQQKLLIPGISFSLVPKDYLGEALFTRTLFAELRGSNKTLGSDSNFLQVHVQAERVFDFHVLPKWHLLLRGEFGATALSKTSALAPTQRFFAGGDHSVRGFGLDDLSPVTPVIDPDTNLPVLNEDGSPKLQKTGGKHLAVGSVEIIRDLPWNNFAIAVFADAGNAFDTFGDPLMYSVGIGFRLRLPVVSVGIDIAQALTTPAGSSDRPGPRLHLNFSPKL
jgi:translocation and assembly module TamA